ncbi:hypothetical protein F5I97DRAFT_111447 [Phlebopus sp. FC_14]|nr:hypothetical protein F5I97DRAFT_111447 [Phlebopus sp. FC_14]
MRSKGCADVIMNTLGWIITYVIDVRGAGASSGYISTGFSGELMFGRLALMWVNEKVGERRVLFLFAILAIAYVRTPTSPSTRPHLAKSSLEFIIWCVPSLAGDAVAVAVIGTVMGPTYPIAMNQRSRALPRWLLTGSIGWIAGLGQAGSAIVPFMAGAVASKAGIRTLQSLYVASKFYFPHGAC